MNEQRAIPERTPWKKGIPLVKANEKAFQAFRNSLTHDQRRLLAKWSKTHNKLQTFIGYHDDSMEDSYGEELGSHRLVIDDLMTTNPSSLWAIKGEYEEQQEEAK